MRTLVRMVERKPGGWPDRGSGRILGPTRCFDSRGRKPWCSRGLCRTLVATIFRWQATHTGTIGIPARTCVGLHTLHAQTVHTALGYCEVCRSGGCNGPRVPAPPPPADGVADGVCPLSVSYMFKYSTIVGVNGVQIIYVISEKEKPPISGSRTYVSLINETL